ncbi:MAG: hypothetical protein WCG20_02955 [bacterium]
MTFEQPITLKSTIEKRDANKKKKKLAPGEKLTIQEKTLLKQEKSQEVLERVEKKRRLKKSINHQEEYHSENGSTIFTGPDNLPVESTSDFVEQPSIDDLSFEDIVVKPTKERKKRTPTVESPTESISTPDIDEKKKLLDMFGTDNPTEIDAILNREEENGNITANQELTPDHWDDFQVQEFNKAKEDKFDRYLKGRARTQQEQIESHQAYKKEQKPWLSRIKNWFKRDSEVVKNTTYEQHRDEIDRMLDSNIEADATAQASEEYQAALERDQEQYDRQVAEWEAYLNHQQEQNYKREHVGYWDDPIPSEEPHEASEETINWKLPEEDQDWDFDQEHPHVAGQEELAIALDNQLTKQLKTKKRAPRGSIKGFGNIGLN